MEETVAFDAENPLMNALGLVHASTEKDTQTTIVVDLDGTIIPHALDSEDLLGHEPFPGARETIHAIRKLGVKVIIWTARGEEMRSMTEYWLSSRNIEFDELRLDKPKANLYIDDKALRFTSWSDVIQKVLMPKKLL
jgi:hypothetical protein